MTTPETSADAGELANEDESRAAAAPVHEFVRRWRVMQGKGDTIYGVAIRGDNEPVKLSARDLALLVKAVGR